MKRISLLITLILITAVAKAQDSKDLARVGKINGVPVYILSEPLNDYQVVLTKHTGAKIGALASEGLVNEGINEKVAQYVTRISREARRKRIEFDAILYTGGKRAAAIKFDQESSPLTQGLARVDRVNGVHVFILSEPVNEYEVLTSKNGGLKAASYLSQGHINRSISGDVGQFVKRIKRKSRNSGLPVEAVIYNAGKRAIGVKFQ